MAKTHDPTHLGPNIFKHVETNSLYRVVNESVMNSTNGPDDEKAMVLYISLASGRMFVRTHEQFYGTVDLPEGDSRQRFLRVT